MEELKPCPFCGGQAKMQFGYPRQQKDKLKQVFIKCCVCKAKTATMYQQPYQAWEECIQYAIFAWNKRC